MKVGAENKEQGDRAQVTVAYITKVSVADEELGVLEGNLNGYTWRNG